MTNSPTHAHWLKQIPFLFLLVVVSHFRLVIRFSGSAVEVLSKKKALAEAEKTRVEKDTKHQQDVQEKAKVELLGRGKKHEIRVLFWPFDF